MDGGPCFEGAALTAAAAAYPVLSVTVSTPAAMVGGGARAPVPLPSSTNLVCFVYYLDQSRSFICFLDQSRSTVCLKSGIG